MYAIPVTSIQHVCITIGDDGDGGWVSERNLYIRETMNLTLVSEFPEWLTKVPLNAN